MQQRYKETSEKYEVYFNIFHSECAIIFEIYLKDTKKRARNMKFTSIFFTASALYLQGLPQRYDNKFRNPWTLVKEISFISRYFMSRALCQTLMICYICIEKSM